MRQPAGEGMDTVEKRNAARALQPKAQLTREQILRNQMVDRELSIKEKSKQQNFGYLDVFEQEREERQKAHQEFKMEELERQRAIEARKPAFFQKTATQETEKPKNWREEEKEAYYKLQKALEMNFDPASKTHEELREFFKLPEGKESVTDMTERMFDSTMGRLKARSNTFYAFLNKQFNIMNFKSARCSMHCFDSPAVPLSQVQTCLQTCRQGITECRDLDHNLQKGQQEKLSACIASADEQKHMKDPVTFFLSCYEKTTLAYDDLEAQIEEEFSNYV